MFLPGSYAAALVIMLCGMFFWGAWPNSYKLTRNWRFELFYWDYAIGIFLTSVVIGLTLGTFFGDAPTYLKNIAGANHSAWLYAIAAGALWNIGNILLVMGVALVGMAVAFPLSIGLALVCGVIGSYVVMPRGNPALLFTGVAMVFVAVILNSLAYRAKAMEQKKVVSKSGLIACVVSGIFFSGFGPLVGKALSTAKPLGPYGICTFFTFGALLTTVPMMMYIVRHPVEGTPLGLADYFKGTTREHGAGLLGGFIWGLGTASTFVPAGMVGIALAYAIGQANPLIAALFGVFIWHEFKGAPRRANVLLGFMFLLYVVGLLTLALSFKTT
jgi:glucose uptake protein